MKTPFKVRGYNSVSPCFTIYETQKFIYLIKLLFNEEELRHYEEVDNPVTLL